MIHLADVCRGRGVHGEIYAPCGVQIGARADLLLAGLQRVEAGSALLAEVSCPECRSIASALTSAFARGRRNHSIPWAAGAESTRTLRVLEELADQGGWRPFDLKSWLVEPEGEYIITLRVRAVKAGP
jgi:hypothetical protein